MDPTLVEGGSWVREYVWKLTEKESNTTWVKGGDTKLINFLVPLRKNRIKETLGRRYLGL